MSLNGLIKPVIEVSGSLNWNLLFRQTLTAQSLGGGRFAPIPPLVRTSNYSLLLIGSDNPNKKLRWELGCWCNTQVPILPDSGTTLLGLADVGRYPIPLGRFRLIWIPDFDVRPFYLSFSIPNWHERLDLEAWWFDGDISNEIIERLTLIQEAVT